MKLKNTQQNEKIIHAYGLEELTLLKCSYYVMQSTDSGHFFIERELKILKLLWTPKDLEQPKQSWERKMELGESGSLTSDYTTKLQ